MFVLDQIKGFIDRFEGIKNSTFRSDISWSFELRFMTSNTR